MTTIQRKRRNKAVTTILTYSDTEGNDPATPRDAVPPDRGSISRLLSRGIAGTSMSPIDPHTGFRAEMHTGSFATVAITRDEIRVLLIFNDYVPGGDMSESSHFIPRLQTGGSVIDLENSRSITLPVDNNIPNDSNIINLEYDGTYSMVTYIPSAEDMDSLRQITMTGFYEEEEYVGSRFYEEDSYSEASSCQSNLDQSLYNSEEGTTIEPAPTILRAPSIRFRGMSGHEVLARGMDERRRILSSEMDDNDREAVATIVLYW